MSRCRSCDAEIRWAKTPAGKSIPLDFEPSEFGNVGLRAEVATVMAGDELAEARTAGRKLFMPHHATCPQGRAWRKKP